MSDNKDDSDSLSIQDLDGFDNDLQDCKKLINRLQKDSQFKKLLKKSVLDLLKPIYAKLRASLIDTLEKKLKSVGNHDCKAVVENSLAEFITEFDEYYQKDQKTLLVKLKRLEESVGRMREKSTIKPSLVKDNTKTKRREVSTKSAKIMPKTTKQDNSASFSVSKFKANSSLISKSSNKRGKSKSTFDKLRDKDKEHKQNKDRVVQLETEVETLKGRLALLEEMMKHLKPKDKEADRQSINRSVFDILGSLKQRSQNNNAKSSYSDNQTNPTKSRPKNFKQAMKPAHTFKSKGECKVNSDNEFLQLDLNFNGSDKENTNFNCDRRLNKARVSKQDKSLNDAELLIESQSSHYMLSKERSISEEKDNGLKRKVIKCISEEAND